MKMSTVQPFQWRDTRIFLKDGKEAFKGPVLFDQPEKYPAFVEEDSELERSEVHEAVPILPEGTVAFPGSRHFLFINESKSKKSFEMFPSITLTLLSLPTFDLNLL